MKLWAVSFRSNLENPSSPENEFIQVCADTAQEALRIAFNNRTKAFTVNDVSVSLRGVVANWPREAS